MKTGMIGTGKCVLYLASLSFLVVQHVEQEPKLTGETELALTKMTQQDAAQRLNVVQHLYPINVIQVTKV